MSNLWKMFLAAALGALASNPVMPIATSATDYSKRSLLRSMGIVTSTTDWSGFAGHTYPAGPGWTNAQVKRMAKKRRNKARHKAARKGK